MSKLLSTLLALLGALGLGAFFLHVRQLAVAMPLFASVVCALLVGLVVIAAVLFSQQLLSGFLQNRGTPAVVFAGVTMAVAVAVLGAIMQMAAGFVFAKLQPADSMEYGSIEIAVTRLLVPSFFFVFHCLICFVLAAVGVFRRSTSPLVAGLVLSMLTLYVLGGYARVAL
jgi:hypothetical protein